MNSMIECDYILNQSSSNYPEKIDIYPYFVMEV